MVVGQRDDVVPVAAELEAGGAGQVAGDGDRARQPGQAARQQLALEHADQLVLGVEGARPHQGLPCQVRCGGEQGPLVRADVVRGVPADEAGARHAVAGGQRQYGQAARADLGERRFQRGAGRPYRGAALAQRRGQGRHGAHGRVGPLGAPLRPPHLRPGLRLGRVEDGDDQPVALQLGERDPVGAQRAAQRGHHGLADISHGDGGGQGGGQALHPGHVGDVGAELGGVGDGADETGRASLAAVLQPAAQPQPPGRSVGLEHPELQLAVADRHVVGLHHGHQRGQVLGDGQAQQGLHPSVEVVRVESEQLQDVVVHPDPAGVHGEAEAARRQVRALGGDRRLGEGDGVGDEGEARPVVGVEAAGPLAHREQTAAAVVAHGQGGEVELAAGRAPRLGLGGQVLRAEPHRPPAVRLGDRARPAAE